MVLCPLFCLCFNLISYITRYSKSQMLFNYCLTSVLRISQSLALKLDLYLASLPRRYTSFVSSPCISASILAVRIVQLELALAEFQINSSIEFCSSLCCICRLVKFIFYQAIISESALEIVHTTNNIIPSR